MTTPQTDNLVRSTFEARAAAVDDAGTRLHGHFSVFDNWYEIDSVREGRFLERVAPGAFADTLADPSRIKVLFDHGFDPQLGNKPLGTISRAEEDDHGAAYEVELIDTDYNRDFIVPAAQAGLLGSSFRFSVRDEDWVRNPERSDTNPNSLPERTITRLDVHEFGPVTFPANPEATAGIRSRTDELFDRLIDDPMFLARFIERTNPKVAEHILSTEAAGNVPAEADHPHEPGNVRSTRSTSQRRALVALRTS